MITKAASVTLVVAAGSVLTAAVGVGAVQLVQNSTNTKASPPRQATSSLSPSADPLLQSGGTTAAAAAQAPPPGQAKKTPSPGAEPPSKSLILTPSPLTETGLVPGASRSRTLTVQNPNNQPVELQSVSATVLDPSPPAVDGLTCTAPADFEVLVAGVTPVTIAKNGSQTVPVVIRMNDSATRNQDACKSQTFSFTLSATATSK